MGLSDGAIGNAITKHKDTKAAKHYQKEQAYISGKGDSICLIIQRQRKDSFTIYDAEQKVRYFAQGYVSPKNSRPVLQLQDPARNIIGLIQKVRVSQRSAVFHETNPADYLIEANGQQLASVKTVLTTGNELYAIEPYGWTITGKRFGGDYNVNNGNDVVAHISKRKGYDVSTYILDFPNDSQEIIALMIALTIVCIE